MLKLKYKLIINYPLILPAGRQAPPLKGGEKKFMQPSIHYIILAIIILLGVAIITIVARRREKDILGEPSEQTQDGIKPEDEDKKNKLLIGVIVGLVILAVAGVVVNIFIRRKGGSGENTDTSFVSFIPIWLVAFIPILAKKKKKGQLSEKERRVLMIIVGIIVLLLALGVLVFVYLN